MIHTDRRAPWRKIVFLLFFAGLTGCTDDRIVDPVNIRLSLVGYEPSRYPAEVRFHELSESHPEFAGYYWDMEGNLHVILTNSSRQTEIRSSLDSTFESYVASAHVPTATERRIIIHQSKYNFKQLARWRDILFRALYDVPGFQTIGVNVMDNTVEIGGVTDGAVAAMRGIALSLGVPEDGVIVRRERRLRELQLLSDRFDVVGGGIRITTVGIMQLPQECTLGANTLHASSFVTNSHCTDVRGPDDPEYLTEAHQPQPFNNLGLEDSDPPYFSNAVSADCPSSQNVCRYSDAAVFLYDHNLARSVAQGTIKRTVFAATGANTNGSVLVDGTITIVSETEYSDLGWVVDKIGQSSGWTYGVVTNPCRSYLSPSGHIYLCSAEVNDVQSLGGDSGSPTFLWLGNNEARFLGLLHAGDGQRFLYSQLGNMRRDLGFLRFTR